jgi:hypothetical protein
MHKLSKYTMFFVILICLVIIAISLVFSTKTIKFTEDFSFEQPFLLPTTTKTQCRCPQGKSTGIDPQNQLCLYCSSANKVLHQGKNDISPQCYNKEIYNQKNYQNIKSSCENNQSSLITNDDIYCFTCPSGYANGSLNPKSKHLSDSVICKNINLPSQTINAERITKTPRCPSNTYPVGGKYCAPKCNNDYQLAILDDKPVCVGFQYPEPPQTTQMICDL